MASLDKVHGYMIVYAPNHPASNKNGYAREHRLIWFNAHGPIPEGFEVHHRNGIKTDNRLENLELISVRDHRQRHANPLFGLQNRIKGVRRSKRVELKCHMCRSSFERLPSEMARAERKGSAVICCSRRCSTRYASEIRLKGK